MKLKISSWSLTPYLLIIALVGLQACGGGGDPVPEEVPVDANPTGYYDTTGTVTVDDDGVGGGTTVITDLQAMINGNRFMMISDAEGLFYDGTITSISTNDFAANVSVFKHGQLITDPSVTVLGTITEKSKIEGTLTGTGAGNSSGIFTLQYASNNNVVSDLSRIERDTTSFWDSEIGGGYDSTILEIDAAGDIVSVNAANDGFFENCILSSGSFSPIAGTSLYNVTINTTNCLNTDINTYSGLAASWTDTGVDNRLAIGVTDATSVLSINGDFRAQ